MKLSQYLNQLILTLCIVFLISANAKPVEENEYEFIKSYSGQTKSFVKKALGKPKKVDYAVKPSNADSILKEHNISQTKPTKNVIEMWYYDTKIKYAPKKFFSQAELTFVNDKCVNITFSNKRN